MFLTGLVAQAVFFSFMYFLRENSLNTKSAIDDLKTIYMVVMFSSSLLHDFLKYFLKNLKFNPFDDDFFAGIHCNIFL